MGIKKGKTMIELPRLNSVSVMTSNVGSTHMTPREDYVRLSDATTYGDQRAAEARDQMREECVKEITQLTTIYTDKTVGFDLGYTKASNLAVKLIKGLK